MKPEASHEMRNVGFVVHDAGEMRDTGYELRHLPNAHPVSCYPESRI
jgi:hypothetical protein